jgi:hypothetical protein
MSRTRVHSICIIAASAAFLVVLSVSSVIAKPTDSKIQIDRAEKIYHLATKGVTTNLDLSDDGEYGFFLEVLELGGKTRKNSPQTYKAIDAMRHRHLNGKFKRTFNMKQNKPDESVVSANVINTMTGVTTDGAGTYQGQALSTMLNGSPHTFGLITLRNRATHKVFAKHKVDDYGSKVNIANLNGYSTDKKVYAQYTGFYLNKNGQMENFNLQLDAGQEVPVITNEAPISKAGTVTENIVVCVNRAPNTNNQCQYGKDNNTNTVKFPVKGAITYPNPVQMTNTGVPVDGSATMFLVRDTTGGGCIAWGPKDASFWAGSTFTNSNKNLAWNFGPASFGNKLDCMQNGDTLNFTLRVDVFDANFNIMSGSLTSSPPTNPGPNWKQMSYIKLFVGCLSEGTMVELASGRQVPIETIEAEGEQVVTGNGTTMTVIGNTIGTEEKPMIRITTDLQYELLVTGTHPIVTRDGGIKLAQDLEVGEFIVTRDGAQSIAKVTHEKYSKNVYNIALGAPGHSVPKGSTTFFANGILVGDHNIQEQYAGSGRHSRSLTEEEILAKLPKAWHQDYYNWRDNQ